ncbi:MAG: surface lipoprotein assembly modifier [Ostreibacterium sp.]
MALVLPSVSFGVDVPTHTAKETLPSIDTFNQPRTHPPSPPIKPQQTVTVNKEILLANPALLERTMNSVLLAQNISAIQLILPIYQQLPNASPITIDYANAMIAQANNHYKQAISLYRKILTKHPDWSLARLNLALALYADHQNIASVDQLQRLRSEEQLPKPIGQLIQSTLDKIHHEQNWQFDATIYYKQNGNINNAPKQRQINFGTASLKLPEPISAHGFHLDLSTQKRYLLTDSFYSLLKFSLSHDYYWDADDYNDLNLRAGFGLGYRNATTTLELQPFVKRRFFGNNPYSTSVGLQTTTQYWFNRQWALSGNIEWAYEKYDDRKFLQGNRYFIGISGLYLRNAQQYWRVGVNYYRRNTVDSSDTYYRYGTFISWGKEWPMGISSNLTLSAAKQQYRAPDFFNIKRHDTIYGAKVSLWHRDIHFWDITPRLVLSWEKTKSNHFYYDNSERIINIEFSKTF